MATIVQEEPTIVIVSRTEYAVSGVGVAPHACGGEARPFCAGRARYPINPDLVAYVSYALYANPSCSGDALAVRTRAGAIQARVWPREGCPDAFNPVGPSTVGGADNGRAMPGGHGVRHLQHAVGVGPRHDRRIVDGLSAAESVIRG